MDEKNQNLEKSEFRKCRIKICGLTNPIEAEYLNKNKVDFAGIVMFYEKAGAMYLRKKRKK